jgi:acyl carrier protein
MSDQSAVAVLMSEKAARGGRPRTVGGLHVTRIIPTGFYARARSRAISRRLAATFFSVLPFAVATSSAVALALEANAGQSASCTKASRSEIKKRLKNIIIQHLDVNKSKVTDNARFIQDLGADSLDTVELVMAFEEEFECEIPDDVAEKMVTVKDAIDFLVRSSVCAKA